MARQQGPFAPDATSRALLEVFDSLRLTAAARRRTPRRRAFSVLWARATSSRVPLEVVAPLGSTAAAGVLDVDAPGQSNKP